MLWENKDKDNASEPSKEKQQAYKETMTVRRKWKKWNCLPEVLHLLKLFYKQERQNKGLPD